MSHKNNVTSSVTVSFNVKKAKTVKVSDCTINNAEKSSPPTKQNSIEKQSIVENNDKSSADINEDVQCFNSYDMYDEEGTCNNTYAFNEHTHRVICDKT